MKTQSSLVILLVLFVSGCISYTPSINTATPEDFTTPNFTSTSSPTETTFPTETAVPTEIIAPTATITPTIEYSPTNTLDPSTMLPVITEIHMISKTSGWAVASIGDSVQVLRTSDGGISWLDVTPPIESWSASIELNEFCNPQLGEGYFMDEQRAWMSTLCIDEERSWDAFTSEVILFTTDGGSSWQMSMLPPGGLGFSIGRFINFINPRHGWFILFGQPGGSAGYRRIYITRDGGESWETVFVTQGTPSGSYDSDELAFGDITTGLFTVNRIGWYGTLSTIWTHDGGATWEGQSLPEPEDPSSSDPSISNFDCGSSFPHAYSKHEVSLLVECRASIENDYIFSYYLYSTKDGGLSWESYPAPSGRLHLINPRIGWILGEEIYFTDDGGATWTKINEVPWEGQFSFVDINHGWAVARNDDEIALVKTEDGGRSWMIVEPRLVP